MLHAFGARHYRCGRCGLEVAVCSSCDRGQVYCGVVCSESARRDSDRRAGKRYRETPAGARCNARRQQEFRRRKKAEKAAPVAQHPPHEAGSSSKPSPVRLPWSDHAHRERGGPSGPLPRALTHCSFCGCDAGNLRRVGGYEKVPDTGGLGAPHGRGCGSARRIEPRLRAESGWPAAGSGGAGTGSVTWRKSPGSGALGSERTW